MKGESGFGSKNLAPHSNMRKTKAGIHVLIEYMLAFTIVLNCNSVYAAADIDYHFNEIAAVLTILLVIIGVTKVGINKRLLYKWIWLYSGYYLMMIIYIIMRVQKESVLGFVSRFILFVPFMALYLSAMAKYNHQNGLMTAFINIMVLLSTISAFFWFFGSCLHLIHPNMSINAYWGRDYSYPGYFGLYFERQTLTLFSFSGYRNDGIFTEGPMFSLCLVIALTAIFFIEEYSVNGQLRRQAKKKAAVLIFTLITVMSFSGYALLATIIFLRFIAVKTIDKSSRKFRILVAFFVIVIGGLFVGLLFTEKQQTSSWLIRLDDLQAGIRAWLDDPIFGNGYGTYAVEEYMSSFRWYNTGFSSALLSVLSQGGLVLFSVYLFAFLLGFKTARKTKNKSISAFIGIIMIELLISSVHFTFLILFLISYCYMLSICGARSRQYGVVSMKSTWRIAR